MPNINGYDKLQFDRAKAQQRLDLFCLENADASPREIERRTQEIVAEESVFTTVYNNYLAHNPNADEEAKLNAAKEIRDKLDVTKSENSFTSFVQQYKGKYFINAIENFQKTHKNSDLMNGSNFTAKLDAAVRQFTALNEPQIEEETLDSYINSGRHIHSEMLARKISVTDSVYVPNNEEGRNIVKGWQKETAEVEITIPETMTDLVDDKMVEFLCFSELMKDENLLATKDKLNIGGSTLLSAIDTIQTAKTSFYDNLVDAGDVRVNMLSIFSVMPTVRKNVNTMLAGQNPDAVKESLKSAFNELYLNTVMSAAGGSRFMYSSQRLSELTRLCKEKNIDLGITKEQEEHIRLAGIKRDLVVKRQEYTVELARLRVENTISDGKDAESSFDKNPDLTNKIAEYATQSIILRNLSTENVKLVKDKYSYFSNNVSYMAKRPATSLEKLILEDPDKLVNTVKEKLVATGSNGTMLNTFNHKNLEVLFLENEKQIMPNANNAFDYEGFENELASDVLEDCRKWFEAYKKGPEYAKADESGKICVDQSLEIINALEQKREANKGLPLTPEKAKELGEDYDKLAQVNFKYYNHYLRIKNSSNQHEDKTLSDRSMLIYSNLQPYKNGVEKYIEYKDKCNTLKNEIAAYTPKETLFGVSAAGINSLKWGLTKGEHALHLFDAKASARNDIVEIDTGNAPDPSTKETGQAEVYNTESGRLTKNKFLEIAKAAAEMYEDPSVDRKLKNVLKDVKAYVTAENRAAQQSALAKMTKSISDYKKSAYKDGVFNQRILDKLSGLENTVKSFTNGSLQPSPDSLQGKPAEPNTTKIGAFTRWAALEGELFPHDPSPTDIKQGTLNDCFALSCMVKIAQKNPEKIRQAMRDNNDGTVSVRFYNKVRNPETNKWEKHPVDVRVNKTVPKTLAGNAVYASSSNWVQLMEKAYAVFMTEHYVDSAGRDKFAGNKKLKGYERLEYGNPADFLDAFDADIAKEYGGGKNNISFMTSADSARYDVRSPKPLAYNEAENQYFDILSQANSGAPIMVGSNPYDKSRQSYCLDHGIRTQHAYALMGTFEKEVNGKIQKFVTLRDPYATYSAKYDDKGNLVNNSDFLKGTRRAGTDNMGQFNMEYSDFLRTFDSLIGAPQELIDKAEAIDLDADFRLRQESEARNVKNIDISVNNGGGFADDFEIVGDKDSELVNNSKKPAEISDFEIIEDSNPKQEEVNGFEIIEDSNPKQKEVNGFEIIGNDNGFEVVDNNDIEIIQSKPAEKYSDLKEINQNRINLGLDKMREALASKEVNKDTLEKVLTGLSESFAAYTMNQLIDKVGDHMEKDVMENMVGDVSYQKSVKDFLNYSRKMESKMLKSMIETASTKGVDASYDLLKAEMASSIKVNKQGKIEEKADKSIQEPDKEAKVLSGLH